MTNNPAERAETWRVEFVRTDDGIIIKAKNADGTGAGTVVVSLPPFMADAIIADRAKAAALDAALASVDEVVAREQVQYDRAEKAEAALDAALKALREAVDLLKHYRILSAA